MINMVDFSGKVAVILGAGGGIGSVVAQKFFGLGAKVALLDLGPEKIKGLSEKFDGKLEKAAYFPVDATSEDKLELVKKEIVAKWGKIDILANCIGAPAAATKMTELKFEDFRKLVDTDLNSAFLACKVFGSEMVSKKYGRIVNFTSFHTIATYPDRVAYNVAKSAVEGLTRALAVEWGPFGITVNAVAPGPVRTPRTSWFLSQSPENEAGMLGRTPSVRLADPEDVADLVAFLASDQAKHINGQQVVIDGGWTKCAWWGKNEKKY